MPPLLLVFLGSFCAAGEVAKPDTGAAFLFVFYVAAEDYGRVFSLPFVRLRVPHAHIK